MASHLFACRERKERGALVSTEEQHKAVFRVIERLKTNKLMCILYINIQDVLQAERCASIIKSRTMNNVLRSKDFNIVKPGHN
jgi:hypothetical protein